MTTKKGQKVVDKLIMLMERNPNGLNVTSLQKLINVSRNTIYRYLEQLQMEGRVIMQPDHLWILKEPSKAKTIFGHQYQAILHGLHKIAGAEWDIKTEDGQNKFKELGKAIYAEMKMPTMDVEEIRRHAHRSPEIFSYALRLIQESGTVEKFKLENKLNKEGFPDPVSRLAAIITFEGGYVASEPVTENGFAHYYILAGVFEVYANRIISQIYGGRTVVNVIKIDPENQIVDLGIYVIFDSKTPFIDPKTLQKRVFT